MGPLLCIVLQVSSLKSSRSPSESTGHTCEFCPSLIDPTARSCDQCHYLQQHNHDESEISTSETDETAQKTERTNGRCENCDRYLLTPEAIICNTCFKPCRKRQVEKFLESKAKLSTSTRTQPMVTVFGPNAKILHLSLAKLHRADQQQHTELATEYTNINTGPAGADVTPGEPKTIQRKRSSSVSASGADVTSGEPKAIQRKRSSSVSALERIVKPHTVDNDVATPKNGQTGDNPPIPPIDEPAGTKDDQQKQPWPVHTGSTTLKYPTTTNVVPYTKPNVAADLLKPSCKGKRLNDDQTQPPVPKTEGMTNPRCVEPNYNESTAGADASVEALKLYHMKLFTLADLLLGRSSSRPLHVNLHCAKVGNDRP